MNLKRMKIFHVLAMIFGDETFMPNAVIYVYIYIYIFCSNALIFMHPRHPGMHIAIDS